MLTSVPLGVGSGSGGPLESGHVICPACAHNFAAIPRNARERIAELEAQLSNLREAFRVNMIRAYPSMSHNEITAAIDAVRSNQG